VLGTQFESSQPHHGLSRYQRFPVSVQKASKGRAHACAFGLRRRRFGIEALFRRLYLCP